MDVNVWIGIIIGSFLGGFLGVAVMCLLFYNKGE